MLCWVSSAQRGEANFSWTVLTQLAFRMYNFVLESKRGGLTVANQRLATSRCILPSTIACGVVYCRNAIFRHHFLPFWFLFITRVC